MAQDVLDERTHYPMPSLTAASSVPARLTAFLGLLYVAAGALALRPWAVHVGTGSALSVLAFLFLPMAIVYHGVRIPTSVRGEVVLMLVAAGLWMVFAWVPAAQDPVLVVPVRNVALLVAALFGGMLVSRIIRERNMLVPVCLVAALVDIVSVGWGFTGHMLNSRPEVVAKFGVIVPKITATATSPERAAGLLTMGAGDLVFLAVFFAAANRFGLKARATFWCVYPLAVLAMFIPLMFPPLSDIPALPFIALGFLACNCRSFDLSDDERRSMLIAGILLGGIIAAFFLVRFALQ